MTKGITHRTGTTGRPDSQPAWARCTIASGPGVFCDKDVPGGSPLSLCGSHLIEAYRFCEDALDIAAGAAGRAAKSDRFLRFQAWNNKVDPPAAPPVVYYALIGPVVKIGVTMRLRTRMHALMADELLVTEPGGYELEDLRHRQFEHLRATIGTYRELFAPGDDLISHIEMLRQDQMEQAAAA